MAPWIEYLCAPQSHVLSPNPQCDGMGDGALEVDRGSGGVGAEMGEGMAWAGTRGMEPSVPTALLAL